RRRQLLLHLVRAISGSRVEDNVPLSTDIERQVIHPPMRISADGDGYNISAARVSVSQPKVRHWMTAVAGADDHRVCRIDLVSNRREFHPGNDRNNVGKTPNDVAV